MNVSMLNINILRRLNNDVLVHDMPLTPETRVTVEFKYPLARPVHFDFENANGFTLPAFVDAVCETYKSIYEEEAATTSIAEGRAGALLNRNTTDGKYGVWGHDLGDLVIEGIEKRDGIWQLHIGS